MQQRDVFQQGQSSGEPAMRRASPARVHGRPPRRRRRGRGIESRRRRSLPGSSVVRGAVRQVPAPGVPAADRRRLVASRRLVRRLPPRVVSPLLPRPAASPSGRPASPSGRPAASRPECPPDRPERRPDVHVRRQERDRLGRYRGELGHRIRRRALPNRQRKRHRRRHRREGYPVPEPVVRQHRVRARHRHGDDAQHVRGVARFTLGPLRDLRLDGVVESNANGEAPDEREDGSRVSKGVHRE